MECNAVSAVSAHTHTHILFVRSLSLFFFSLFQNSNTYTATWINSLFNSNQLCNPNSFRVYVYLELCFVWVRILSCLWPLSLCIVIVCIHDISMCNTLWALMIRVRIVECEYVLWHVLPKCSRKMDGINRVCMCQSATESALYCLLENDKRV